MSTYDPTLALHCLAVPLGSKDTACPIIKQRSDMMHPDCEGVSPADTLFSFLVQSLRQQWSSWNEKKERPKKGREEEHWRACGEVAALSYSVAMIRNPYAPNPEVVLAEAEMEASL